MISSTFILLSTAHSPAPVPEPISNTVFIVENAPYFYAHMSVVPSIFYQSLILNQFGIHLVSWGETSTLEQFMFEVSRDGNRPDRAIPGSYV